MTLFPSCGFPWEGRDTWVRGDGILQEAEVIRGCCTMRSIPESREHTLHLLRPGPQASFPFSLRPLRRLPGNHVGKKRGEAESRVLPGLPGFSRDFRLSVS